MRYVVPECLRHSFFKAMHAVPLGAHQGINRTMLQLQQRYYWPNMLGDIKIWCAQCHTCMRTKRLPINLRSPLQQQISGAPFERVAVDLMGPFEKTSNGNLYIAVFQDYFTKWVIAEPLKDKTAMGVADLFYTKWIALFGCPLVLHSDRGGEFKADIIARLCDVLRVEKTYTSPYHSQSDGLVERSNRTLQAMLRAFVNDARDDWDDHLPAVCCAYRSTPHDSTGVSPFRMVFGREITLPIDLQHDVGTRHRIPKCPIEYIEWLQQTLYFGHDVARNKLKQAAERQKKGYQEKCRTASFHRGDWVWKVDSVFHAGKLHKKNKGPFLVISKPGPVNYEIQESKHGRTSIVHVDKLYPYSPEVDEVMTSWLKEIPLQSDVSCQCDVMEVSTTTTECQTAMQPPPGPVDQTLPAIPNIHGQGEQHDCPSPSTNDIKGSPGNASPLPHDVRGRLGPKALEADTISGDFDVNPSSVAPSSQNLFDFPEGSPKAQASRSGHFPMDKGKSKLTLTKAVENPSQDGQGISTPAPMVAQKEDGQFGTIPSSKDPPITKGESLVITHRTPSSSVPDTPNSHSDPGGPLPRPPATKVQPPHAAGSTLEPPALDNIDTLAQGSIIDPATTVPLAVEGPHDVSGPVNTSPVTTEVPIDGPRASLPSAQRQPNGRPKRVIKRPVRFRRAQIINNTALLTLFQSKLTQANQSVSNKH